MSERTTTFDDIAALVAERRKFEDWIRALDAKREKTAPHVFSRVHADYEARLRAVTERLASHQGALGAERIGLEERLAEIDALVQKAQDERSELELRGHVGELEGTALEDALKTSDAELDKLAAGRSVIQADLARISEFVTASDGKETAAAPVVTRTPDPEPASPKVAASPVTESAPAVTASEPEPVTVPATRPSMSVASTPAEPTLPPVAPSSPAPQRKSRASFDELGFLQSVIGGPDDIRSTSASGAPAAETERQPLKPIASPKPRPSVRTADRAAEKTIEKAADQPSLNTTAQPVQTSAERTARQSIAAHQVSMTIEPQPSPRISGVLKAESAPSLLDGIVSSADTGERPYAANVASNTPLSLKGQAGDTKTLKCRECSAMNDPTEWYCERCGAELSAM